MHSPVAIVDSILVRHSAFEGATRRIDTCFEYARDASEPICLALIGESRTGKSRALETCYLKHPAVRLDDGMHVPILRVKAPSKPTVKSLAETMLEALAVPDSQRGTENEKTRRLKILMRNTETTMLMIDEFQHFFDKGTRLVMHHVADWLKILVDDVKCALVVAGLPSCKVVIDQNQQLAGRFHAPMYLSRFAWQDLDQREEFIAILEAFQTVLANQFDLPTLCSEAMAFRCYCATGGLIGYLAKFLRQTIWNAVAEGKKMITLEDLSVAHEQSVWPTEALERVVRPFDRTFQPVPTSDLLHDVVKIGSIPVVQESKGRQRGSAAHESAAAWLVAR